MRGNIINAVFERMATDERLFFLTADMGINLVERIADAYPDRFLNVGIAEQDLIGVSAGLCNAGFRPVAYTISNFLVHRCFEQVRNDIALHDYPVTLLGTSAGFDNASLGPTHHIIDDWGAIAGLPNVDVYSPSSIAYADALLDRIIERGRPAYVRISKGEPREPASTEDIVYRPAARPDFLLATYGSITQHCLAAAAERDDVSLLIFNRLKPIDAALVESYVRPHSTVVVVEDHFPEHGLYGALCRIFVETGLRSRLVSLAPKGFNLSVGSSNKYYEQAYGLDESGIVKALDANALARI